MTGQNSEKGARYRLEGVLLDSRRGPVLQMDDGGVWALETDADASLMLGQRVTVEGVRSGFDRMSSGWVPQSAAERQGNAGKLSVSVER
jgi:hypothetical protein